MLAEAIARLAGDAPSEMLVVPVPLHRSRFALRGFNQARLLAENALGCLRKSHPEWRLTLASSTLMRLRATESQAGLSSRQRRVNVRGAFSVSDPAAVTLKHILLIDDIFTTGATARAAALALTKAGAASVWVATLARARRVTDHPLQPVEKFEENSNLSSQITARSAARNQLFIARPNIFLTRGSRMSLGKAMIHARKQKSIAKAAACAGDYAAVQPMHMLQMPVLVLNASYEPINICGARRALVLVLKGIARTEEEHGLMLHAQRSRIAMPSVIRLLEYRRIPHQTRALSRKNILLRDRNTCQYCGVVLPSERAHPRPRRPPLPRRQLHLGKPRRLLPRLQPPQRQPHASRDRRHDPACATRVRSRCTPAARSCAC